jgi:hypothetical protein
VDCAGGFEPEGAESTGMKAKSCPAWRIAGEAVILSGAT